MALSAHTQTEKTSELEKELADALVAAGKQNMSPPGGMSDDESREWAMRNIAHPIAEAIEKGTSINIKGSAAVAEINAMKDMAEGDIWGVTDSGTIVSPDGSTMDVSMGDLIRFDGSKWTPFIHLSLEGYATDKELEAAIAAVTSVIATHEARTDNPHNVTAEQVGAYTKEQVDGFIRNWSGYVVVPFGQQKPAASEAELGKIYLVQVSTDPEVKDQYEEWISDGTAWSLIGTMSIDLSPYDKIEDALERENVLRVLIDSVAHGTNMVAFEEGQDIFMTILDYFARKPVPWAATFFARDSAITNTLTNYPPILKTDSKTAGFKIDCFCLYDLNSPGSDEKPDYARTILLEYTNNNSDAGYIKFLGRIGNSSHTRPTKPANSYWEQFLNSKMCDGTFNYKSNKVATVKTVTDKINALDVNDAAVANQFVTAVKETDGKVSITRRQPVMADVSGLAGALEERDTKITAFEGDLQDLKSRTLDMKVDSDVVEFFMMEA